MPCGEAHDRAVRGEPRGCHTRTVAARSDHPNFAGRLDGTAGGLCAQQPAPRDPRACRGSSSPERVVASPACACRRATPSSSAPAQASSTHPIPIPSGLPSAGCDVGAKAQRPLGLAAVASLLLSQLVTLYLGPVYYTYLEALLQRGRTRRQRCRRRAQAGTEEHG